MTATHTPGPWHFEREHEDTRETFVHSGARMVADCNAGFDDDVANARLISAAPDMLAALHHVRALIGEAAMTGFNCHDGNWAERLFASQALTHAAVKKAEGQS